MEKKIIAATDLYDADAPINAWVGNLGKYVEGELVGGWIALPQSEEEIDKFLADVVGINEQYEEYAVYDWESDFMDYPGEYVNIYEINEIAEKIEDLDDGEKEIFKAANEAFGTTIEDFDPNDFLFIPDCNTEEELAYNYFEQTGFDESDVNNPEYYIDEEALRRDIEYDEESNYRMDYESEYGDDYDEDDFQEAFESYMDSLMDDILADPKGMLGDSITSYFDYEAFGNEISQNGVFTNYGYIESV